MCGGGRRRAAGPGLPVRFLDRARSSAPMAEADPRQNGQATPREATAAPAEGGGVARANWQCRLSGLARQAPSRFIMRQNGSGAFPLHSWMLARHQQTDPASHKKGMLQRALLVCHEEPVSPATPVISGAWRPGASPEWQKSLENCHGFRASPAAYSGRDETHITPSGDPSSLPRPGTCPIALEECG